MPRVLDAQRFARGSPRGSNGFGCFLLDATRLAAGVPARPLRARGSPGSPRYAERRPASRRQWRTESFFNWNPAGWERFAVLDAQRIARSTSCRSARGTVSGGGEPSDRAHLVGVKKTDDGGKKMYTSSEEDLFLSADRGRQPHP
eukprot:g10902.t1